MSISTKPLGRGLDALFRNSDPGQSASSGEIHTLPLESLQPNPDQPRRHFGKEAMEELAASIKTQGLVQPLLVRPKGPDIYEIVAGERRWRAARMAGLSEVPALVRDLTDEEVMVAALIENLQREDLNPIEEALALNALRERRELTQEDLASRLGKSRSAIANSLRLLQLSLAAQDDVQFGRMSAGHARCLLGIDEEEVAEQLRLAIVEQKLTVRDTEAALSYWKEHKAFPWSGVEQEASTEESVQIPVKQSNRVKPKAIKNLQKVLNEELSVRASVSGSEEKGRITFAYDTPEQLVDILQRLNIAMPNA